MIVVESINKEFVLKRISEEDVFCRYMGIDNVDEKKSYKNDKLRTDKHNGSCRFYRNKNSGILYFNDFAWRSFDCFAYVQVMYGLEFQEAVYKIAVDFNLIDNDKYKDTIKKYREIKDVPRVYSFEYKPWNTHLINYWRKYISWITIDDLNRYNIRPLLSYSIDGNILYTVKYNEIAFVYQLDKYIFQVYAPFKLQNQLKFLTTANKILGLKTLDPDADYVVIIKSAKDFTLSRLLGLNSVGILAETMRLTLDAEIAIQNYKYKFTLFDPDWAGKRASIYYKQNYGTIPLLFGDGYEKDLSDNLEKYGEKEVWEVIQDVAERFAIFL